jgi:gamma-glutamylcyclotransferase (GGCT)/AIG2-like uncharacterized protein YtfP
VYGTLKRGFYNNLYLQNAKYLGDYVLNGYDLLDLGYYPCIVKGKGKVYGEVFDAPKLDGFRIYLMEVGAGFEAFEIGGVLAFRKQYSLGKLIPSGKYGV